MHAVDARQLRQMLAVDAFIVASVCDDHPQQIVRVTRHQIALHHFRHRAHRALETSEVVLLLAGQGDPYEHVVGITGGRLVDQTNVTADQTGAFEPPNTSQARRLRQAYAPCKRCIGEAPVQLEFVED
jgi:hypothetical protein